MSRKYRVTIEMQSVRFEPTYGANKERLLEEAKKEVLKWQKSQRQKAKIRVHEDTGKRYGMPGKRLSVDWQLLSEEVIPYEARPNYKIGDTFLYETEHEDDDTKSAEIIDMRLDPRYDDFYYTLRVCKGNDWYTDELKEYHLHLDWRKQA